jgi:hypothetical protein
MEGILVNFKGGHRVVLSVSLLQRSVAVEVDLAWLRAVEGERSARAANEIKEKIIRVPAASY